MMFELLYGNKRNTIAVEDLLTLNSLSNTIALILSCTLYTLTKFVKNFCFRFIIIVLLVIQPIHIAYLLLSRMPLDISFDWNRPLIVLFFPSFIVCFVFVIFFFFSLSLVSFQTSFNTKIGHWHNSKSHCSVNHKMCSVDVYMPFVYWKSQHTINLQTIVFVSIVLMVVLYFSVIIICLRFPLLFVAIAHGIYE